MNTDSEERNDQIWAELYRDIGQILNSFGTESPTGKGDFFLVDDNYGWTRHTFYAFSLKIIDVEIIASMQALLTPFPEWTIVLVVDIPEKENIWPPMGVTIRKHEIIDGLRREFLPEPYRSIVIPGSRPGTGYD